jgi:hypothetical protein
MYFSGHFDNFALAGVAMQYGAPPSGKYSHRVALAATTVINFVRSLFQSKC